MSWLDKLLGRHDSQQDLPSPPIEIEGAGSTYENPPPEQGDQDYTVAAYTYADPAPDTEAIWRNFTHRRSPDPSKPQIEDTSLYHQEPAQQDLAESHYLMTTPQPSTNEVKKGFSDSPYRYPEKWAAQFRILRPTNWSFERKMTKPPIFTEEVGAYSLADNIRAYPVGGMTPTKVRRNTLRFTPDTRDESYVDMPPPSEMPPVSFNSPEANTSYRAFRLG